MGFRRLLDLFCTYINSRYRRPTLFPTLPQIWFGLTCESSRGIPPHRNLRMKRAPSPGVLTWPVDFILKGRKETATAWRLVKTQPAHIGPSRTIMTELYDGQI